MPGIICSAYSNALIEGPAWERRLDLVNPDRRFIIERFSEPGFDLACIYHPEVCQGPRLLAAGHHVLAIYGNVYDDDLNGADGQDLCRILLDRFLHGGPARLQHLNGCYDIAVWDRRSRALHIISDRFGGYRHYYLKRSGCLHVGCEVKALSVELDRIEVDPGGLASMLIFGYHVGDLTIVREIRCLPNACHLQYRAENDRLHIVRYWDYPFGEQEPLPGTEDELAEALHGHLMAALKRRLKGVDKLLLPISGGLDSRTLAALLHESGFAGNVTAYSYGEANSRDVRYGRSVARKLGYPHIAIPKPDDFITRHLKEDAWRFDAEWSGELHWGFRFAYSDPALGDTSGYRVLSGMYGDTILGTDKFRYRQRAGDKPLDAAGLRDVYLKVHQEYAPSDVVLDLFCPDAAAAARSSLDGVMHSMFSRLARLVPFYALTRAEFEQRQHRHTSMVAQSIERDKGTLTPFLDTAVVDFVMRIPYETFYDKRLYQHMFRIHFPELASIPYAGTGLPIADAPIRSALQWRLEKGLKYLPRLQRRLRKRTAFFRFHEGIIREGRYFAEREDALRELAPPLDFQKALERYQALVGGRLTPAGQACAFLPPALFIRELRQRCGTAPGCIADASARQ